MAKGDNRLHGSVNRREFTMNIQVKAVIFDWAGTIVDFGSLCPVVCFKEAFAEKGVELEGWEIHRFMGTHKLYHVQSILELPEVRAKWQDACAREPHKGDRDSIFATIERLLIERAGTFATPVPHFAEAMAALKERGIRTGSSTGYTAPMMERIVPAAKEHGVSLDAWVSSDQVSRGRPSPWMIFRNMELLDVCPPHAVVKVGDTIIDMLEAHNAGVWSVGVVESSSLMGMDEAGLRKLPAEERNNRKAEVREQLRDAGAHFVINHLGELDKVISVISSQPVHSTPHARSA